MPINPQLAAMGTLLVITPLSGMTALQLTPYAARNLTQTLELIRPSGDAWTRRDVNGVKRSLADTRFRKYKSVISCTDGETPCLDDGWIGQTVEVFCACELNYLTGSTPARPAVSGSSRVQGAFTYYRPVLIMMVDDIRNSFREWAGMNEWQLSLEEV